MNNIYNNNKGRYFVYVYAKKKYLCLLKTEMTHTKFCMLGLQVIFFFLIRIF